MLLSFSTFRSFRFVDDVASCDVVTGSLIRFSSVVVVLSPVLCVHSPSAGPEGRKAAALWTPAPCLDHFG